MVSPDRTVRSELPEGTERKSPGVFNTTQILSKFGVVHMIGLFWLHMGSGNPFAIFGFAKSGI